MTYLEGEGEGEGDKRARNNKALLYTMNFQLI
jgi:hypothetical protein